MKIFINNEMIETREQILLSEFLDSAGIRSERGVALALNEVVIPKSSWHEKELMENDKILVIRASQGG
jgi:sulfur carrier protein